MVFTLQIRLAQIRGTFIYVTLFFAVLLCWMLISDVLDFRPKLISRFSSTRLTFDVVYENCSKIPHPPKGSLWPEETYIHDSKIADIRDIADPDKSRVRIDGKPEVQVGDIVHVGIQLYDGFGRRKTRGGDLIRVWIREPELGASASARVTDNQDSAIFTAFWEGNPTIKAAIISPREVIATQFRRRYICPLVLVNTAVFEHPSDPTKVEETPCSYDPHVPGYPLLCNFTSTNYGSPWFCGQPRTPGLLCDDWTMIADKSLILEGEMLMSDIEKQLTKLKARIIPTNLTLRVGKDKTHVTRLHDNRKCNEVSKNNTWPRSLSPGYLYNRNWINRHCSGEPGNVEMTSCLRNTKVVLIGDSTVRQLFDGIKRRVACDWLTGAGMITDKSIKHRPGLCINQALNFTLQINSHSLPFCTSNTARIYFKTFVANLDLVRGDEKVIVILHAFAHFLNYHSHVFYETLQNMKKGVVELLKRKPSAFVVIKGPHAYSFSKNEDSVMWMPEKYADVYKQLIQDVFSDMSDRIMYLECHDITASTEQWHIHAEEFIINALVANVFSHACPYKPYHCTDYIFLYI